MLLFIEGIMMKRKFFGLMLVLATLMGCMSRALCEIILMYITTTAFFVFNYVLSLVSYDEQ